MAAILSRWAMLDHRPLRRGCLIEFLYPTGCGILEFAHHGHLISALGGRA